MQATAVCKGSESGIRPICLDTGAPDFERDASLADEMQRAFQDDMSMDYPPLQGLPALRHAIAGVHKKELGLPHTPDQVLITYGAMQAVFLVCSHLLTPGDEVLLPAPYWFRFPDILTQTGARTTVIPATAATGYKLTPERLAAHIGSRTRLLVLIHPNNPTGATYSHAELDGLAEVLARFPRVMVLSDEAYNQLPLGRPLPGSWAACESLGSWPTLPDRVLTVNSLSKNYAAAGLRIGYVAGPQAYIDALAERIRLVTLGVSAALQRAALCLMRDRDTLLPGLTARLRRRCHRAADLMKRHLGIEPIRPDAGYYFWVDAESWLKRSGCDTDVALAAYLLDEVGVAVLPGSQCGLPGFLRLTFAVPEDVFAAGISAMQPVLAPPMP